MSLHRKTKRLSNIGRGTIKPKKHPKAPGPSLKGLSKRRKLF